MNNINVSFRKYITYKGENIFEMIKTKTNKYYLVDCKTNNIVAYNKKEILDKIKEYGSRWLKNE